MKLSQVETQPQPGNYSVDLLGLNGRARRSSTSLKKNSMGDVTPNFTFRLVDRMEKAAVYRFYKAAVILTSFQRSSPPQFQSSHHIAY
jgi:hypothetical protein